MSANDESHGEEGVLQAKLRDHRNLSILVVDDDKFTRQILMKILTAFGMHDVATAQNGDEALRHLALNHVDLVISDILMKGMDGLSFIKNIRQDDIVIRDKRNIPVIFLTAYTDERLVRAALKLKANGYLTKPLVPAKMIGMISKLCHSTLPTLGGRAA